MGLLGSNGPLKAVWVGGVQINGLVHLITEENLMDPSLTELSLALTVQITLQNLQCWL